MSDFIQTISDWEDEGCPKKKKSCTLTVIRGLSGIRRIQLETQVEGGGKASEEIYVAEYCSGPLFIRKGHFNIYSIIGDKKEHIGIVRSPGWLSSLSLISGPNEEVRGGIYFSSTSRDGKLMNLSAILPEVNCLECKALTEYVHSHIGNLMRHFPWDVTNLIAGFAGKLEWLEPLEGLNFDNLKKFPYDNECNILRNRRPTWNTTINAYTLEFHGRAQVPSVHNFQLVREEKDDLVLLQLGKFDKNKRKYNLDYRKPLTTLQAFSICICVCSRTFVRD